MVKFKDFSRPLSVFPVLFKANLLFKTVLYIQVLFKPVQTLEKLTRNISGGELGPDFTVEYQLQENTGYHSLCLYRAIPSCMSQVRQSVTK